MNHLLLLPKLFLVTKLKLSAYPLITLYLVELPR